MFCIFNGLVRIVSCLRSIDTLFVESYELKYYAIDAPNPIEAIKFRMEQEGLIQNDLVALFGNKPRVSEVLNKKRKLSVGLKITLG